MKFLGLILLLVLAVGIVTAGLEVGYNSDNPKVDMNSPEQIINYSVIVTNSSTFWGIYNFNDYNMPTIKLYGYNQSLPLITAFGQFWYNYSLISPSSIYNATYNGLVNNASYLSTYNASYMLTNGSNAEPNVAFPLATKLWFGSDTNLYRSGANVLKTDDSLIVMGNFGVGTTNPTTKLHIENDGGSLTMRGYTYTASGVAGLTSQFSLGRARGTQAVPASVQNGDALGGFLFQGYTDYDGSFLVSSSVKGSVDGTHTSSDGWIGGRLDFNVIRESDAGLVAAMTIRSTTNVGIGTTAPNQKLTVSGVVNASGGFMVNGSTGLSGTYQIIKDVDLIGLTKTYCNQTFTGGLLTATTC